MTVSEAIAMADSFKPNQYTAADKIKWLSALDGMIYAEILTTHEGEIPDSFSGYTAADTGETLLVPYPYDADVYNAYLQSCIDRENGEMGKYNQSVTLYNSAYKTFCDWYNRSHRPIPKKAAFVF